MLGGIQLNRRNPLPIRLSCRLEILPGHTVSERLNRAARYGFDAVSLPGRHLDEFLEPLAACRRDYPVPLAALSLGFDGSMLSPRATERKRCCESVVRLFDLCVELGIPALNMPPALIQDNPERIRSPGEFSSVQERLDALLLEQLPEIGEAARERNVLLLLEPVNRSESEYLNRVAHAAELCRRLAHPNIGVTADFYHMRMEESDIPRALRAAGKYLKLVHVAEAAGRAEPGSGSFDFLPGFATLKRLKYRGFVEVECRTLSGPPETALPASVRHLRDIWSKA